MGVKVDPVVINDAGMTAMRNSHGVADWVVGVTEEIATVARAGQGALAADEIAVESTSTDALGIHGGSGWAGNRPAAVAVAIGRGWKGKPELEGELVAGTPKSFQRAVDHFKK